MISLADFANDADLFIVLNLRKIKMFNILNKKTAEEPR